jgi:hypothetical protein
VEYRILQKAVPEKENPLSGLSLPLNQTAQLLRQRNQREKEEGLLHAPFPRIEDMFRRQSATESDLDFYGEPIPGITAMFMNCTISEDRTGTEEEIMTHRLAALGARREQKMDWRKIR